MEITICRKDAKIFLTSLNVFVNFWLFSVFGTKRKHTGLTSSEYAKELVRIGVLEEKLYF